MRPIHTDGLAILQATHIFPINFLITEARPTMCLAFLNKLIPRTATRGREEQLSGIGIVKVDVLVSFQILDGIVQKCCFGKVRRMLGVMSIKIADTIINECTAL